MPLTHLTPLKRDALLQAYGSPTRSLVRACGGYMAQGGPLHCSGVKHIRLFTRRLLNMLEYDGLVAFDKPQWPNTATLTPTGIALAEQLHAAELAKAGAA